MEGDPLIDSIFKLQGEESNSSANKNMLKVAQYAAKLENYERAIQIYEQVGHGHHGHFNQSVLGRSFGPTLSWRYSCLGFLSWRTEC